jgi:hypothetical protein
MTGKKHVYEEMARLLLLELMSDAEVSGVVKIVGLDETLHLLRPRIALVCGTIAQATFKDDMVGKDCHVMRLRHPAARDWTNEQLDEIRSSVKNAHDRLFQEFLRGVQ